MESLTLSRARTVSPPAAALRLLSDERLARSAAQGSEAAFSVIFERHHQALHRYCHSIVGNGHDAADALQNTMVKALRALPGETRHITLKPWLYRIAHNESISLVRARRGDSDLDAAAHVGDLAADGLVESRERMRDLSADLRELTEQQRGALLMRELGGLEFIEVAGALSVSAAAAKQSVYEARCALQTMSEGRAMDCDLVRRALSDGDRRTLRALKLRGHLRSCAGCHDFQTALDHRPGQLAALAPPLPLGLAAAMLHSVLGGAAHGGGGGLAAGLSVGAGTGQGGAGLLTAGLGAGAKASAALSLGVAKVAAVVVVAGGVVAGGAVYVVPHDDVPSGASSALGRDAARPGSSVAQAGTAPASQVSGRLASSTAQAAHSAAAKMAEAARALAEHKRAQGVVANASGAAGRESRSAGGATQRTAHAKSTAAGRDPAPRKPTQPAASKAPAQDGMPAVAKAPSPAATSQPGVTQPDADTAGVLAVTPGATVPRVAQPPSVTSDTAAGGVAATPRPR